MSDLSIHQRATLVPMEQTEALLGAKKGGEGARVQSPNERQIASHKLTPPPKPKESSSVPREELMSSVSEKAKSGWVEGTPSRKGVAQKLIGQAREKAVEARKMGVDVAKHSFWKKLASVAVAAVGVAIFAGLTAVSFGGATPLLGIACAAMANSIGDAVCAYRNYKNTEAEANHKPLPYAKLPMGNSFLGNMGFKIAKGLGRSDDTAKIFGKAMGVVIGGGLAVSAIALSAGIGGIPMLAAITSKTATGINAAVSGYSALGSAMTKDLDKDHIEDLNAQTKDLVKRAKENDDEIDGDDVIQSAQDAMDIYDKSEEQAERQRDVLVGLSGFAPLAGPMMDALLGPSNPPTTPPPTTTVPENVIRV